MELDEFLLCKHGDLVEDSSKAKVSRADLLSVGRVFFYYAAM